MEQFQFTLTLVSCPDAVAVAGASSSGLLETKGLALCSMHHKLFDRGAFTLTDEFQFCVSQKANGSTGLGEWLTSFRGLPLKAPQSRDYLQLNEHLEWHRK